jgi:hypothetical protein
MTIYKLMTEQGKVAHEVDAATRDDAARLFDIHLRLRFQSQPGFDLRLADDCFGFHDFDKSMRIYRGRGRWVTTLGVFHVKEPGQPRKTESRMGKL